MDTQARLEESYVGIIAAETELFERLCSEERSFGARIERTIQEIDDLAQGDVTHAEAKFKECQIESAAVRDRLQKAREGSCPSTTLEADN
jgi:hypothetical protein